MNIVKKTYILIFISFLISIVSTNIFINKYDKYEISTDDIENHQIVKGDIPDIWIDGEIIKRDLLNGKNYFESGKEIFRSYLPPRLIALYSHVFNYSLFENWDKRIISSNNSKIYYLILQTILYYIILIFFFKQINKFYDTRVCFFIICFLALEPTIFLFHSSFHTESLYFSLQILLLSLMIGEAKNKIKFIFIGILLGIMFLQKIVTIYYLIPLSIFYIYKLRKKSIVPLFIITFFYLSILLIVGFSNYVRANVFYIMPPSSKITFYLYLPAEILVKNKKISYQEANEKIKLDKEKWVKENNINFDSEPDRIKYYNYQQKYTFKILLDHPIGTAKYVVWKTFQTSILNPIYILEFFSYENAKKPEYYLTENYKKINIPIRIFYSLVIYYIVAYGFIKSFSIIRKEHYILFTLSVIYMLAMLGWAGNSRYFAPILIYLSFFFGHGIENLINTKKNKFNTIG